MGQFKPMVKMETTEPSVILKLKKGGHVNMKKGGMAEGGHKKMAGGGAMEMLGMTPAFVGRPAVNAPVKSPGKPSMAKRKKAMAAKKPAMAKNPMPKEMPMMPPMKKGGSTDKAQDKAMIKKAFKQHDKQEHKGGKGTDLKLKKGGKMATGGVAMANAGGYKKGGMMDGGKACATGGVAMANAGGYATGGVAMANAGGYKDGGKTSKKAYAAGGTVNSGKPVAMQEGNKSVPAPKRQQNFSGAYKEGGEVEKMAYGGRPTQARPTPMRPTPVRPTQMQMGQRPAQTIRTAPIGGSQATRDLFASRGKTPSYKDGGDVGNKSLQKINEKQNAPAVKASKADTNLKYPETMNSPQKTPKLKC